MLHYFIELRLLDIAESVLVVIVKVEGYIVTACMTSVRIDNIVSWYKIAIYRLIELF